LTSEEINCTAHVYLTSKCKVETQRCETVRLIQHTSFIICLADLQKNNNVHHDK